MTIFSLQRYEPLRAPEGGGGGLAGAASGEGEREGGGPEPAGGGQPWTPPEGVPSEYLGGSADETLAKLLPAFTDVSKRADGLREKLSKMPAAPGDPSEYSFTPDEKLAPYFGDFDKSPAWEHARAAAQAAGLSNEQLQSFISGVYGPMVDGGLLNPPYNPQSEIKSFQSSLGLDDKGTQQALVDAEAFAKGITGQLKGIPEAARTEVDALLLSLTDTSAGNLLLRALSGRLAENGIRVAGGSVAQGELTDADIRKLHSDPRIDPRNRDHSDPNKRFDPDLRRRYDEATNRPQG
uniref:hypothetical protein n=1 Tax=Stappia sp. TaxID=1870903 RepID=UPI003BA946E6